MTGSEGCAVGLSVCLSTRAGLSRRFRIWPALFRGRSSRRAGSRARVQRGVGRPRGRGGFGLLPQARPRPEVPADAPRAAGTRDVAPRGARRGGQGGARGGGWGLAGFRAGEGRPRGLGRRPRSPPRPDSVSLATRALTGRGAADGRSGAGRRDWPRRAQLGSAAPEGGRGGAAPPRAAPRRPPARGSDVGLAGGEGWSRGALAGWEAPRPARPSPLPWVPLRGNPTSKSTSSLEVRPAPSWAARPPPTGSPIPFLGLPFQSLHGGALLGQPKRRLPSHARPFRIHCSPFLGEGLTKGPALSTASGQPSPVPPGERRSLAAWDPAVVQPHY